jgi:hypothetical protein
MHFEDVFGLDGDDALGLEPPGRTNSGFSSFLPLTPEKEDDWTSISADYAVSPVDISGSFADGGIRFSNKFLVDLESANRDLAWIGRQVSEEVWGVEEMRTNLENFYTWLLRFSIDCPFKDVRKGCRAILQRAEVLFILFSPTADHVFSSTGGVINKYSKHRSCLIEIRCTTPRGTRQRTLVFHPIG